MKISLLNHRCRSKQFEALFCGIAITAAASGVHGAILVSDNFTNSSGASANMQNTQAPGVGTYERVQGGTGNLTTATVSGFGNGNVLQIGNNANTYFRAFNDSATLKLSDLASGQTLSLSFDFRSTGDFGTGAQNFGFGFLNAESSIAYVNLDARSESPVSEFRYRTGSGGFNMSSGGTAVGTTWNNSTSAATNYNFELSITRTDAGYLLRYLVDGVQISSATNPLGATSGLDITGIGFRWGEGPGTTTNIDNVLVQVIPEPSSLLLVGGSTSCLLLRRRKRQ